MSRTFHIVAERAAVRCDICHQADCFNPMTGGCERCDEVTALMRLPRTPHLENRVYSLRNWKTKLVTGLLYVIGLPVYFFLILWAVHQMEAFFPIVDDEDSFALLLITRFFFCLIPFLGLFFFCRLISLMNREPREVTRQG